MIIVVQYDDSGGGENYDDEGALTWHIVAASSLRPNQTNKVPPGANLFINKHQSLPKYVFDPCQSHFQILIIVLR